MIATPYCWSRAAGANLVTLTPPDKGGRIRIFERLPPNTFEATVEYALDVDPGFEPTALGETAVLLTSEGEYGAWLTLAGTQAGRPAARAIGAILLDDFVVAIDALSLRPETDALIIGTAEELLRDARFRLGVRPRRFLYRAPESWQALPSGLTATWYPPDFPAHRAQIVVEAAQPSAESPATAIAALAGDVAATALVSPSGLRGALAAYDDGPAHVEVIVWTDGRYAYPMRLETAAAARLDEDREAFLAAAMSVQPLPSSRTSNQ